MRKRSVLALLALSAFLAGSGMFAASSLRHGERNDRLEGEIEALQAEAERIRIENSGVAEKIAYLSSPEFREREAKEKLGLKRMGEHVVALSGAPAGSGRILHEETTLTEGARSVEFVEPNYIRWWNRFFGPTRR